MSENEELAEQYSKQMINRVMAGVDINAYYGLKALYYQNKEIIRQNNEIIHCLRCGLNNPVPKFEG